MKKILKKLLICICLFLTLFNFSILNNNVMAAGDSAGDIATSISSEDDVGAKITKVLSGIVGILTWGFRLPLAVGPLILQSVGGVVAGMEGTTTGSFSATDIFLTPETVIFNKINLTSIDFFTMPSDTNSATYIIREQISLWYFIMRVIAAAILLGILIFVGIKMSITTIATEKAIYKKALVDWATSLALVFLLHYIIRAVLWLNTGLVDIMDNIAISSGLDQMMSELRKLLFDLDFITAVTAIIVYIMITVQALMFLISYIKRMLTLAFLIIISPLITITYSIDKMGDQKAQALNTWLKEFSYNVLIQPFHCILYLAFVNVAIKLISDSSGTSIGAAVLAILAIKFVWDGEKIVRKIFGFEQASSLAAAAASGAVVGSMLSKAQTVGKGAASGIKFAKNSKTGQMIKQKHDQRKDTRMKNKAAQLITGNKNATYNNLSNAQRRQADKQVQYNKEQKNKTPIRRMQEKREYDRLKKKAEASGANIRDSVLKEKASKNIDKKNLEFKNNHKILSAMGSDAAKYTRKLIAPENIARVTAGATIAAAMYAMPDSNLVTSIGAGHIAGKSASEGVKILKENKKEHFEENIMKAWNNHCNITGNDKNSKEEFNKWYENTYNKGKKLDEYSQKNMGKAEGAARKDLQEAGMQHKDLDAIISQLQKAILTKEPYDPVKLFKGYKDANDASIDPSVIAAAVASYATKFNESYAYKNVSDYNTQMSQFGVTADDAVNGISDSEFESYLTPQVQSFVQPESTAEVVETSTNTTEQLESEQLELVSQEYEDVRNNYDSADISNERDALAALESIVEGKLSNIESEIKNNLTNMGYDQSQKIDRIIDQIQSAVENINPDLGSLEGQINNIVSTAMSKVDFRGVSEEKRTEIQSNLREYTNKQVVNNYMTNNYGTSTTNVSFNADKIRSDLEKIANINR